jgi:uncharacterized protein YeaO (DUF488 family)
MTSIPNWAKSGSFEDDNSLRPVISTLIVHTAQVTKARGCTDVLDITVKTGDPIFAPTWNMVMGYKWGRITATEYTEQYRERMLKSWADNKERWLEVLNSGSITLVCYCPAGFFCHRLLLVDLLQEVGSMLGIEIINMGEL